MTEEIIIDGVDVSRCVSFDKLNGLNICCYSDTREDEIPFANFCVENKDCNFKQLKRKEQECEELKEKQKELLHDCNSCKFHLYKQALDEIEEFCTVYSADHDAYEMVYKDILAFINKAKEQ